MIDGLREHKKRQTRQRISDVATALFIARGFEAVTIAEIASAADVSEKTVYNYFPTKESLVYDQIDEQIEQLVAAVRDRPRGTTPITAFVVALKQDSAHFAEMLADIPTSRIGEIGEMVSSTPALRAAWGEHRYRIVSSLTRVLAQELGVDPQDPEPAVAARALVSLLELSYDSRLRHAVGGIDRMALQRLVEADIDRGARLLDTGMWSLHLMVEGRRTKDQIREAAMVADQARQQVMAALREAKRGWRGQAHEIRDQTRAAAQEQRRAAIAAARAQREAAQATGRAQREAAQAAGRAQREAAKAAGRAQREAAQAAAREHREQARQAGRQRH